MSGGREGGEGEGLSPNLLKKKFFFRANFLKHNGFVLDFEYEV